MIHSKREEKNSQKICCHREIQRRIIICQEDKSLTDTGGTFHKCAGNKVEIKKGNKENETVDDQRGTEGKDQG